MLFQVADFAVETPANVALTPLFAYHPGAVDPRWTVADVLVVATIQLRYPMALFVSMKGQNLSLHDAVLSVPLPVLAATRIGAGRMAPAAGIC